MKKVTLFLVATLFSALSFAALNPYAYGLSSSVNGTTLTINYSLNAPATAVSVVIMDGETEVKTIACDDKTAKDSHTVEISTLDLPTGKSLTWKVVVNGTKVDSPTKQTDTYSFYLPYSMDVDVDTESDYFGRWYVIEATNGGQGKSGYHSTSIGRGLYAFDAALNPIENTSGTYGFSGGMTLGAIDKNVYGDYINLACVATSGGRVFVGSFRSTGSAPIWEATDLRSTNYPIVLTSAGGRAVALDARGSGENLQLVMLDTEFNIKEYDLGTATSWATPATPSRTFNKTGLTIDRNDAAITYDNNGGVWINQNSASNPTIAHLTTTGLDYDNKTAALSHVHNSSYNIRGAATNPEGTELAVPGAGRGKVSVFSISKDAEGKISLAPKYTITTGNNNTALSYDYAGNLYVANRSAETITFYAMPYSGTVETPCASKYAFELEEVETYTITAHAANNTMGYVTGGGTYSAGETVTLKAVANSTYCFVSWSDGNTENPRTFTATADVTLTANFAKATPRAWAYDLKMVEDSDKYKFSFTATTAANATLLFLDKEGNELYAPHDMGAVAAGANTVSIEKAYFTQVKDVYWSVKMDGKAINSVAEITDQSRGIYDFYNMMGVLVDNNPNSNEFGKIYIQASINGASDGATARSDAQKAGLFIYDQGLNELNQPSNVGIAPTVPSGYEWGAAYQFHRLAVDPKTSNLVYSYAIASKPAVFSMDRANLTGTPTNLIEDITGFTRTVAHCFDAEGTLYVMDIASSKGTIYKVKDGVKTAMTTATGLFVNQYISMAADGRGGLWVSHNRGQIDGCYQLAHVTSAGAIDWYVNQNSTHGFIGGSVRGALAYDAERHILAQGRNSTVEVFQVAYDATTGVPTLTKIATTPQVNKANIDALAFDYAGDLYVCNSGTEKFYKYTLPTAENICTVPAPESQAIIKEVRYTITVNTVGNGTATGAGEYVAGETATLEASPAANHQFVNWTYGSETSTNNPLELVVNSDITVTAKFAPVQYTLIAPTNDEKKGTVTGAGTYNHGAVATLTATPKAGYKLLYWSDRSTENPRTITMTKNEAISAYFVKEYTEEPTFSIKKVWENTNVPASTSNGYQAVGWDGKIYMQDAGHSKIITFSDKADTGTEYATSGVGQQIAVDEAGNLIVFNATFYVENPNSILIYKKGETTNKPISFTLPQPQRCDFFSASGDIYSAEGGYVYFYCKTKQVVNRVKIANGELVSVDVVGNNITAGNTQNHVMLDIFGNLVAHSRSAVINATINVHTSESMAFTLQNHKYSTLGGCTFELGGKEFWAYNVGTTNYTSEWNIYNMTDKKFCSDDVLYAKDKISTNTAANWLNVQVVNENTAYIYQFCPKVGAAVWEVKMLSGNLHTVTVVADNGTVDGNAGTYENGATATLTAKPNTGYKFVSWTKEGTVVSTDATYTFTVTEDVTLVANFEALPQYTITATSNDAAMGTVTGGGTYYLGTEVTLTASAVGGYVFSNWSDGNTDNPRTIQVTADATYTANFKVAIARVFAYNLDMIDNGDSYTFSFIPNANAISGRLIVYNDSKAQVLAQPITSSIVKGVKNEMTISKASLPAKGTWAIELTGEPVESLTLLTKANDRTNYGFNRPQGVAIDNSPESDYFGRMYIALPKADGGYSDTNYGIVVMDPLHNRLKSGVVAYGDALGSNGRYSMHRIAVNPTNGHVYYVRTSDSSEGVTGTAIYELTPNATSILTDGGTAKNVISGVSEITNANSVCFDETGTMYVVANANYTAENGSTGRVYKVVDGNATLVTQSSRELASKDNSIVPDGKGGFWIAQHRNNLDGFNHLLHIDASGNANYTIDNATNTHLLPVQTYTKSGTTYNNASYRGQVAYYSIDENNGLVAYGGGAKVSVFKATYDGSGVPTLESWQTISLLSSSSTDGINVDGLAFDYAGNLIVMSATDERMYQYALPTNNNTSIVPAKSSLSIGEVNKITYELNGGVWNKYGWTSKKDMYNAFIADWKAYSGSTRGTIPYEDQFGIGKSNAGIPVTIQDSEPILDFMTQSKWGWLAKFLDALAEEQNKGTKPSEATRQMRYALGNFFGEDNNGASNWIGAVDCSGDIASLSAFAPYWGQTFPMPTQPAEEVVLNAPYKEKGYEFDGWYTTSNFSGAEVTMVDENTNGTLYAKWTRNEYTRSGLTSGRYGTICLPYNSNYFEGAIFYEVAWMNTSVSPWQVLVDEVTELEAGKPYIFMATSNNILVACQGDAIASPSNYNGLYGTFTDINDGPAGTAGNVLEDNHMLSNNQIMKCLGNCILQANRAYFKLDEISTVEPALMPGRRRVALGVQGGNEATGLDNLTEDGIAPAMEGTYDVLGRKMTETTNTGFYIVNGKKVVVLK